MELTYDAFGNRLSKTVGGNETFYLYNGGKVSSEISSNSAKTYLYGMYGLRGVINSEGFNDVYTDHLGSPRIIGRGGSTVSAAHYTAFGKPMPITGDMCAGFNGYKMDDETGLYYSIHRFYDSETCRFLSLDPKAAAESPYVFCGNDPITRADPNGDKWWSILLGVVAGLVGAAATVATAGLAAPEVFGAEAALFSAKAIAAGTAAGAVGTVSGELVTAACEKIPITGKMVLGSLIIGATAGGLLPLIGPSAAFVGHIESRIASYSIACTVGAAVGIGSSVAYSAITDIPISATSMVIGGLAGMCSGLIAARAYTAHSKTLMHRRVEHKILKSYIEMTYSDMPEGVMSKSIYANYLMCNRARFKVQRVVLDIEYYNGVKTSKVIGGKNLYSPIHSDEYTIRTNAVAASMGDGLFGYAAVKEIEEELNRRAIFEFLGFKDVHPDYMTYGNNMFVRKRDLHVKTAFGYIDPVANINHQAWLMN